MAKQYGVFPKDTEHSTSENRWCDEESHPVLILQPLGCTKSQEFQLEQG